MYIQFCISCDIKWNVHSSARSSTECVTKCQEYFLEREKKKVDVDEKRTKISKPNTL